MVDSEVSADGGDPAKVKRRDDRLQRVPSLAAGKVDAATGFWNAEGVALRREGVPIRIFKVNDYGAPPYPELVLAASRETIERDPDLVRSLVAATARGYELTVRDPRARPRRPARRSARASTAPNSAAQLEALLPDLRPAPFDPAVLRAWARWDLEHGLLERPLDVSTRLRARLDAVSLAADFQQVLDAMPPDWTDLELDLRIEDESRYVDAAVTLSQVNAQPYSQADWDWRLIVAHSFGHAAAAETVKGVLAKLDAEGIGGEMQLREVREGRAEVVQMWGRPESVREEFRERRSL